jgi:CRP/FNR family transcriptional regulator
MSERESMQLSAEVSRALDGFKSSRVYAQGHPLFLRGQSARGVYVVESGEVRLLLPTNPKSKQVLQTVGPGTLLGLSESVSGGSHKLTAEAVCPTHISFIPRKRLMAFLRNDQRHCWSIVRLLSDNLHSLYQYVVETGASRGRRASGSRPD